MVPKSRIDEILDGYDLNDLTIATLCSHSSLQIFHGARKMGLKTLGLTITHSTKYYDAFPLAKPDNIIKYQDFDDMEFLVTRALGELNGIKNLLALTRRLA